MRPNRPGGGHMGTGRAVSWADERSRVGTWQVITSSVYRRRSVSPLSMRVSFANRKIQQRKVQYWKGAVSMVRERSLCHHRLRHS
jgi:hypothetical protein